MEMATQNATTSASDAVMLVARILLALMFVSAGFSKIGGFEGTAGYIASKGLPLPQLGAAIAIVVELAGGIMLIVGWKARWAALAIAVFTAAATVIFHNYWAMTGADAFTQRLMFWKNVSVIGGLLAVYAFGPGRWSIDRG
jgi:putative oxidoreductase